MYEQLHKERQNLIVPIIETEEQYIDKWDSVKYQGKEFIWEHLILTYETKKSIESESSCANDSSVFTLRKFVFGAFSSYICKKILIYPKSLRDIISIGIIYRWLG